MNTIAKIVVIVMLFCSTAQAAPALFFSDLTSGPNTGIGDGLGEGTIVTIWGHGLGSSQGTSTLSICGQSPAYIYYWKNADGTLPGGPADLYTSHKMQEIAFSVPDECSIGSTTISVTIDGVTSNTLPFTVRTGRILHVKSTGNDTTGDGSWASPYLTCQKPLSGTTEQHGDVIYSHGVGGSSGINVGYNAQVLGTEASPISLSSYPNTLAAFSGKFDNSLYVINNWYPSNRNNRYVHFSKIKVTCYGNAAQDNSPNGIYAFPYGRIVGVEITGPTVYQGSGGAITGSSGIPQGGKYLGMYIHHYGYHSGWEFDSNSSLWTSSARDGVAGVDCTNCTTIDSQQHLYYISCRVTDVRCEGYEIGWNHLVDNPILESIHIYDMGDSGWFGELLVHDNVLIRQRGFAIDIAATSHNTAEIKVWNNLIIDTEGRSYNILETGVRAKFYNNTSYNETVTSKLDGGIGGMDFHGNIMVDTTGVAVGGVEAPDTHSHNLMYSTAGATVPAWALAETGHVSTNPQFVNAAGGDFSLSSDSPAINAGYTNTISTVDITGLERTGGFDIGAYEYSQSETQQILFNGSGQIPLSGSGTMTLQ